MEIERASAGWTPADPGPLGLTGFATTTFVLSIYNANLVRALAKLGHEVHLLCQDRQVRIEGVEIHNPDIGGLLPVYVKDPYEGFEVKSFPELTEAELQRYIDANVSAVRDVAAQAGRIDLALANHLVMGPAILARADIAPFAAKVHGSALEYTVKPNPRFLPYAREGMEAAAGILVGSRPRIVFVGKLIVSKGVDLLLAAWPLVHRENPDARLEVAGYGEYEDGLRRLLATLEAGELSKAREIAAAGWGLEGGEERPLPILSAFLADPPDGYGEAARAAAGSVELIGRLEHDEVAELLPGAEALVMPSTFPEAFGMVAAEAAACGVLPVSAGHSGMLEVSRQLRAALPPKVGRLTSFPVEEGAVGAIAERLNGWLELSELERDAARQALVETARRLWSWEGVARGVIAAARGELDRLPDA